MLEELHWDEIKKMKSKESFGEFGEIISRESSFGNIPFLLLLAGEKLETPHILSKNLKIKIMGYKV